MNKLLKITLGIVAAVVVLIVAAVILLALFFNANDYRGQIEAKVQQATGRSLVIGSIHLSVFPTLGLKLSETSLGNAKGFGDQPFAQIGAADVGVRLLPLVFQRKLEVGTVYLSDLKLNLQEDASGKTNWTDLAGSGSRPAAKPASTPASAGKNLLAALDINGVNIDNASIHYRDAQTKRDLTLDGFNLSVDNVKPGKPSSFRTSFKTRINQPAVAADVQSSGKLSSDPASQHYQLQNFTLNIIATGKGVPGGKQTLKLSSDIDYDGANGSAHLAGTVLNVAGVTAHVSVLAKGIGSKDLSYSGPLRIDPFSPREAMDALGMTDFLSTDASALKQASLSANFTGGSNSVALHDVKLKLDQTTATGSLGITSLSVPAAEFALNINAIDADHYLPAAQTSGSNGNTPKGSQSAGDDTPIPVKALDGFTAKGTLKIGKLTLHGVKMNNVDVALSAVKGAAKDLSLKARLYNGSVASTTRITPGSRPGYVENLKLVGVDIGPLMKDATGNEPATGNGNVSAALTSSGNTVGAVERALGGNVAFKLNKGAIKGFNLGEILRNLQSLQQGGAQAVASGSSSGAQQTDFTALSASGRVKNGVLTSNDLDGASPLLRLSGAGTMDLVQQTLDYTIKPMVVNTATGQGGKSLDQLRGIEIPVTISGPFSAPKYRVNLQAALQQKATQKLRGQANKEIDKLKDKLPPGLGDKLKGLFGDGSK